MATVFEHRYDCLEKVLEDSWGRQNNLPVNVDRLKKGDRVRICLSTHSTKDIYSVDFAPVRHLPDLEKTSNYLLFTKLVAYFLRSHETKSHFDLLSYRTTKS